VVPPEAALGARLQLPVPEVRRQPAAHHGRAASGWELLYSLALYYLFFLAGGDFDVLFVLSMSGLIRIPCPALTAWSGSSPMPPSCCN